MLTSLRPAISMVVLYTVLLGLVFPLGFVGLGRVIFPVQSGGSLVVRDGHLVGSALIGQEFASARYFHGRPSAITGTDPKDPSKTVPTPYDGGNSAASNLGPTARALHDRVAGDAALLERQGATSGAIPMDAVTSSGSGLDPDISPQNAALQVRRVAAARGLAPAAVRDLLDRATEGPMFGLLGAPRINVLRLNMALDRLDGSGAKRGSS